MTDDPVAVLFDRHYADLLRYAVRRVGVADAPDVVADVFVVVCRRRTEIPATSQRAWLFGVAALTIRNQQRSSRRRDRLVQRLADEPRPEAPEFDAVHAALARLRPDDRELLTLVEWDGLSVAESAAVLDCGAAALRVRLHRARRRFAAEYEREVHSCEGARHD